jgi:hypothetical protein
MAFSRGGYSAGSAKGGSGGRGGGGGSNAPGKPSRKPGWIKGAKSKAEAAKSPPKGKS